MICPLTLEPELPACRETVQRIPDCAGHVQTAGKGCRMERSLSMLSDGALVFAWRDGDTAALQALVDRHRSAAFGLALRLCGKRENAEDLAQEAFLRALSHLHQYDAAQPFRPWLFRILARLHIDRLRKQREFPDDTLDPPPPPPRADSDLFVHALLDCLSPQHRAILVLRELAEFSYQELASYFHIPLGTVRSRLVNARIALKAAYVRLHEEMVR